MASGLPPVWLRVEVPLQTRRMEQLDIGRVMVRPAGQDCPQVLDQGVVGQGVVFYQEDCGARVPAGGFLKAEDIVPLLPLKTVERGSPLCWPGDYREQGPEGVQLWVPRVPADVTDQQGCVGVPSCRPVVGSRGLEQVAGSPATGGETGQGDDGDHQGGGGAGDHWLLGLGQGGSREQGVLEAGQGGEVGLGHLQSGLVLLLQRGQQLRVRALGEKAC